MTGATSSKLQIDNEGKSTTDNSGGALGDKSKSSGYENIDCWNKKKKKKKKKDILRKKILLRELKLDLTSCIFMFKRFYRSGFIPQ